MLHGAGWWYADGVLRPKLVTAFLAVDPCTVENGALQVRCDATVLHTCAK